MTSTHTLEARYPVLKFFKFEHLPPVLREFSQPFAELAHAMALKLDDTAHLEEVEAGLRKLLEAKDCFVRARLPATGAPIPKP